MSEVKQPREVTMQDLIDAGLNAFALQLFMESIAERAGADKFDPIRFSFRGILVTLARDPDRPFDGRHH
jgi:hypothetical protein